MTIRLIASLAIVLAISLGSQAGVIIYNDSGGTQGGGDAGEAANMNKIPGNSSGVLKDYVTGLSTGITYTGMNGASQGITTGNVPGPGDNTEFGQVFNGILNQAGAYYAREIHFTISGLNPEAAYEMVIACNRPSSNNWNNCFRIEDVTSFDNTSSVGTTISATNVASDTTTLKNSQDVTGYVVRFANIKPGADGDFVMYQYSQDPVGQYTPVAYICGFRLTEVPEPATMSLLAAGGLALIRRKK